jgi:hypothetical protein
MPAELLGDRKEALRTVKEPFSGFYRAEGGKESENPINQ